MMNDDEKVTEPYIKAKIRFLHKKPGSGLLLLFHAFQKEILVLLLNVSCSLAYSRAQLVKEMSFFLSCEKRALSSRGEGRREPARALE